MDGIQKYVDVWILFVRLMAGVLALHGLQLVSACPTIGTIGGCNKKK